MLKVRDGHWVSEELEEQIGRNQFGVKKSWLQRDKDRKKRKAKEASEQKNNSCAQGLRLYPNFEIIVYAECK